MTDDQVDRRDMSLKARLSVPEAADPPWRLTGAATALFALFVCLVVIGPALVSLLWADQPLTHLLLMLSWSVGMALATLFVVVNRRGSEASWRALQLQNGSVPLPLLLLYGVAIGLAIGLLVSLASGQFLPVPEIIGVTLQKHESVLLAALLLLLLQPVAETLVFQGIVLPTLRWRMGPWSGVLVTSALYAALHLMVFSAASATTFWFGIVYPLLSGLAFCLLKVLTTSTRAVILARMGAGLAFLLTALALVGS